MRFLTSTEHTSLTKTGTTTGCRVFQQKNIRGIQRWYSRPLPADGSTWNYTYTIL